MAESISKRLLIGTHNGHFHADEALAVHMLRTHMPAYAGASLVRTRDPEMLATCHTVVDVGGEYSPARNRYDHHQRGFDTTFPGRKTKLSSAGLVYLHFGREIVARRMGIEAKAEAATDDRAGLVWRKLYESFIEALDAHDNGIGKYDAAALTAAGLEKRFSDGAFTLAAMVGRRNGEWNEVMLPDQAAAQAREDENFERASRCIGEEFDLTLDYYVKSWLPARAIVEAAFAAREEYDPRGRIMVFKEQSAPWKDHLYTLEEEHGAKVDYVLYPEKPTSGAKWRVQCVPVGKDSFQSRQPLPEPWRGFRDEQLDGISGIDGCVFVHAGGFIGGNKTFDGALAMARKALEVLG